LLLGSQADAAIADGVSVELGQSYSSRCDLTLARVGVQKDWQKQWPAGESWHLGGYWEASLGRWANHSETRTNSEVMDIGFTPTFRLERNQPSTLDPYLEAAVGFHLLSHASVTDLRQFGCAYEFGDHAGLGIRFGARRTYDLSYRFQHLSNAGIKAPNRGINYNLLRFGIHF
jgi:hypothetical protein